MNMILVIQVFQILIFVALLFWMRSQMAINDHVFSILKTLGRHTGLLPREDKEDIH